jgi:hypothetical protein
VLSFVWNTFLFWRKKNMKTIANHIHDLLLQNHHNTYTCITGFVCCCYFCEINLLSVVQPYFILTHLSYTYVFIFPDCGNPTPIHGIASYTYTTLGAVALLSCNVGYVNSGQSAIECSTNGQWNGSALCTIRGLYNKTIYLNVL